MRSTFDRSSRNDGRSSSSSSLARQTTRIRPWPRSASSSMSSRKVGSAQWTSSKTRTSGLSAASASQNCRKIQAISGAGGGVSASSAASTASRSSLGCACWTTSRSGQYVMPSPYERQRPQSAATFFVRRVSSAASRDLPTPGGPETTATLTELGVGRAFSPRRSAASSRFRPTSGASSRRSNAGEASASSISRYARTGSFRPLMESSPSGSRVAAWSISRPASSPTKISSDPASCSSRAAMPTASPVTSRWRASVAVATTSPVSKPIRTSSPIPCSSTSWALRAAMPARMSSAARAARNASSSCETGVPKAAITASPANFSTVPPCRVSAAETVSK